MADFDPEVCIWTNKGGSSLELLGFPPELCRRTEAWLKGYFEKPWEQQHLTRREFNAEGRSIAETIKRLLGHDYTVIYRYILPRSDDCGELTWEEEVVDLSPEEGQEAKPAIRA